MRSKTSPQLVFKPSRKGRFFIAQGCRGLYVGWAGVKNGLPTHGQEAQNALRSPFAVNHGVRA